MSEPTRCTCRDKQDGPYLWERALDIIKNVVVILTCVVIVYAVYRGLGGGQ